MIIIFSYTTLTPVPCEYRNTAARYKTKTFPRERVREREKAHGERLNKMPQNERARSGCAMQNASRWEGGPSASHADADSLMASASASASAFVSSMSPPSPFSLLLF